MIWRLENADCGQSLCVFMYPSKEVHDKVYAETIKPWAEKVKGKYTDRYRVFGVEE